MKKSKRILILFAVVEALLAGIMIFLVLQVTSGSVQPTVSAEETIGRIGASLGAVMGGLGAFLLIWAILLRRRGE